MPEIKMDIKRESILHPDCWEGQKLSDSPRCTQELPQKAPPLAPKKGDGKIYKRTEVINNSSSTYHVKELLLPTIVSLTFHGAGTSSPGEH